MEDLIDQMAKMIIEQNKNIVGKEIAQNAIEKVNQDKAKRKGRPKKQEVEEGGTKRGWVKRTKNKTNLYKDNKAIIQNQKNSKY